MGPYTQNDNERGPFAPILHRSAISKHSLRLLEILCTTKPFRIDCTGEFNNNTLKYYSYFDHEILLQGKSQRDQNDEIHHEFKTLSIILSIPAITTGELCVKNLQLNAISHTLNESNVNVNFFAIF